jgi:hypothetical protein
MGLALCSQGTCAPRSVTPGFDPGVHHFIRKRPCEERWMRGSSPCMTKTMLLRKRGALRCVRGTKPASRRSRTCECMPIHVPRTSLILLASCPMRERFLEAVPKLDRAKAGRTGGAPERSMAWWPVERWEALRLALGARGALPREVGTLIPPPRVPIGTLAPPTAPSPRLGSRGTGKPRTLCAARM